ncbi:MAG: RNA polymerase sigma factor [Balneolaceae bacterium]
MDYSELVEAINEKDMKKANMLCARIIPILKKYLISTVGATPENAEDAVQKMFEYVIPKIQNNEIQSPSGLLSYMLTSARHSYYKILREYDLMDYEMINEQLVNEPDQPWRLLGEDKESILLRCLNQLKSQYRKLVQFMFDHPNADTEDIAEYFDISVNNVWIRKHRVIQQLNECVRAKYDK